MPMIQPVRATTAGDFSAQARSVACREAMSVTWPSGGASRFAAAACTPTLKTWPCASMNPGSIVLPPRSTTWVAAPFSLRISSGSPTARILPSFTAIAPAVGWASSTVTMVPPV